MGAGRENPQQHGGQGRGSEEEGCRWGLAHESSLRKSGCGWQSGACEERKGGHSAAGAEREGRWHLPIRTRGQKETPLKGLIAADVYTRLWRRGGLGGDTGGLGDQSGRNRGEPEEGGDRCTKGAAVKRETGLHPGNFWKQYQQPSLEGRSHCSRAGTGTRPPCVKCPLCNAETGKLWTLLHA